MNTWHTLRSTCGVIVVAATLEGVLATRRLAQRLGEAAAARFAGDRRD
jgi:hypothetical protein